MMNGSRPTRPYIVSSDDLLCGWIVMAMVQLGWFNVQFDFEHKERKIRFSSTIDHIDWTLVHIAEQSYTKKYPFLLHINGINGTVQNWTKLHKNLNICG